MGQLAAQIYRQAVETVWDSWRDRSMGRLLGGGGLAGGTDLQASCGNRSGIAGGTSAGMIEACRRHLIHEALHGGHQCGLSPLPVCDLHQWVPIMSLIRPWWIVVRLPSQKSIDAYPSLLVEGWLAVTRLVVG